jgi:hypothetical protein
MKDFRLDQLTSPVGPMLSSGEGLVTFFITLASTIKVLFP